MSLVFNTFGPAILNSTYPISTFPVPDLNPRLPSVTADQVSFVYAATLLPRILMPRKATEYPCPTLNFPAPHTVLTYLFFLQRF